MLSMLEILPPKERNLLGRCWRCIFRPPTEGKIDSAGSVPFVRIYSEESRHGHDWRMIEAHNLDPSGRMLMPVGIDFPQGCGVRRFFPTRFSRRMLENIALDVLVCSKITPSQRRLAIYGLESEVSILLPALVPLVGELRIITRRAYALEDIVSDIISRTGMPITMSDTFDCAGSHILLAPSGGAGLFAADERTMVISPDSPSGNPLLWISSTQVEVPPCIEDAYRDCYDKFEFTAAFYEIAGMRELGCLSPKFGIADDAAFTAEELAMMLYTQD